MATRSAAEVFRAALNARLAEVHTALPGEVVSYDAATQTANVQPLLRRVEVGEDGAETVVTLPELPSVPVLFPRAATAFVSLPIAAGDTVLLVFAERSLDRWRASGGAVDPGQLHMHALSDAVAIPGVFPTADKLADAHAENIVVGFDGGGQIHITPAGEVHLGEEAPTDFVALATNTEARLAALEAFALAHVHPGVLPGPSSTGPAPGAPTSSGAVAATKVKGV